MKRPKRLTLAIAILLSIVGCVDDQTSTAEQDLCTIEDQEAGNCTLRVLTRDEARRQVPPGSTTLRETYGVCLHNTCQVQIELPNLSILTTCIRHPSGNVTCFSSACVPGQTCPPTVAVSSDELVQ